MTNKFTDLLKECAEIQLLKFLPSQYFLVIGNLTRIKIVYKHSFRDQSKEDDYTDVSQNLMFLELLNLQIHKYFSRVLVKQRKANGEGSVNAYIKSTTHSGTKSKMNGHIYSSANEEHKYIDEESHIVDLIKENSDAFEFMIPGFLIRISKIDGISKMSHDDRYYSVMVFQRFIRRRRLAKKDKESDKNERYQNSYGLLPAANLKERQIMCNSFSAFVKNNLVVDSKIFLQSAMTPKTRKKILSETKSRRLGLNERKTNVLIQSYIQSKEIKRHRNINKNPLNIGGHIKVAKSPFDYKQGIGPENIQIQIQTSNNIGPLDSGETGSIDSGHTENFFPEYHYESGVGSGLFEDSIDKNIEDYQSEVKPLGGIKKIDNEGFSNFFDEESSIAPSMDISESHTHRDVKNRKAFNYSKYDIPNDQVSESGTNASNFFDGQEGSIINLQVEERKQKSHREERDSSHTHPVKGMGIRSSSPSGLQDAENESSEESADYEGESSSENEAQSESSLIGKS